MPKIMLLTQAEKITEEKENDSSSHDVLLVYTAMNIIFSHCSIRVQQGQCSLGGSFTYSVCAAYSVPSFIEIEEIQQLPLGWRTRVVWGGRWRCWGVNKPEREFQTKVNRNLVSKVVFCTNLFLLAFLPGQLLQVFWCSA